MSCSNRINSWIQLETVSKQINELLLKPMRITFDYATDIEVSGIQKEKFTGIKLKMLEAASLSLFQFFDHDITDIKIAFNHTYKKGSASSVHAIKLPVKLRKQEFFEGYKVGVEYLWFSFMGAKYSQYKSLKKIRGTRNWETFGNLFHEIKEEVGDPLSKILEIGKIFRLPSELKKGFPQQTFDALANLVLFKKGEKTTVEVLDEALLYYSIHMLHVHSEALAFAMLLKGYSSLTKGAIRVIKFVHPQGPGDNFSFAILIESYGLISDFSSWVLLYNFATNYSGNGGAAHNFVMEHIKSLGNKILMTEVEVDEAELKSYAEESKMRTLEARLKQFEHFSEKSQSQLYELTAVYVLSKMGYTVNWAYSRPEVLRDKEIDALAVKEEARQVHVLVVEIMETLPLRIDVLAREIREKISCIRNSWRNVVDDFGLARAEKKPLSIEGWVMTKETRGRKKLAKDIYIKDLDYLRRFCESHRIPYRSSLILRKSGRFVG